MFEILVQKGKKSLYLIAHLTLLLSNVKPQ